MTTPQKNTPENLISRRKAADRLGVHINSVDYYVKTGRLSKYKDGRGRVWIDPAEVDRLIVPVLVVASADC